MCAALAVALLVAGCGVAADAPRPVSGSGARGVQSLPATGPAAVRAPPNATMRGTVSVCVKPRRARLRAVAFDGRVLPFTVRGGAEPRCRGGALRILRIQALTVGGRRTYVRRGGCDRPAPHDRCRRQPTVHLFAADLAPVPLDEAARAGNGAPLAGCDRPAVNDPAAVDRRMIDRMYYKRPSELPGRSIDGARWSNYGDPGRRFSRVHLNYLLWNLPRDADGVLPGGGIVEAVLTQGQPLAVCGTPGLSLPSFDRRGRRNGRVRWAYARVSGDAQDAYGWVMVGYAYGGRPFVRSLQSGGGAGQPATAQSANDVHATSG